MNIICKLFGHRFNWHHYGEVVRSGIDGINREHAYLRMECERCGEKVPVAHFHLPERHMEANVKRQLKEAQRLLQTGFGDGI